MRFWAAAGQGGGTEASVTAKLLAWICSKVLVREAQSW